MFFQDDTIQPEDFTNQLQKELNSSPQPCLVPFLRVIVDFLFIDSNLDSYLFLFAYRKVCPFFDIR